LLVFIGAYAIIVVPVYVFSSDGILREEIRLPGNFQTFERLNITFSNYGASINGGLYD
jgi:hypothetical protein